MSTLKVDSITDSAGTGSPSFPNGLSGATLGVTDGSSAAAGEAGEFLVAQCTSTTTTATAGVAVDAGGMTLSLTAGSWILGYDGDVIFTVTSPTGGSSAATFYITDNANTLINGSISRIGIRQQAAGDHFVGVVSKKVLINITNTTTYKVRLECTHSVAQYSASIYQTTNIGNGYTSYMWAQRIR